MHSRGMNMRLRSGRAPVALETTLLVHGVPRESAATLHASLRRIVQGEGATPLLVGVVSGCPTVGMTSEELDELLAATTVPKANTSNLGALIHGGGHAATTVSATMELAAAAGVRVFATGGLGGVHRGFGQRLDISADLGALARFPVAVVCSGVKSLLDVESTREALETLGVPVVGLRTERFPAFYLRESTAGVDARFDDERSLAAFVRFELGRTGRGIVIAQPAPEEAALDGATFARWLAQAEEAAGDTAAGRDATPTILAQLHRLSGGATLRANIALVEANARSAARLAAAMLAQD
ncbi:MAG: pseudouridine-5'-phosphate glycosidase [Planctomycetota bacterium]|nr:pseudouridine-5'-phosphate glycosidase [Planctomycetota bacterium]